MICPIHEIHYEHEQGDTCPMCLESSNKKAPIN